MHGWQREFGGTLCTCAMAVPPLPFCTKHSCQQCLYNSRSSPEPNPHAIGEPHRPAKKMQRGITWRNKQPARNVRKLNDWERRAVAAAVTSANCINAEIGLEVQKGAQGWHSFRMGSRWLLERLLILGTCVDINVLHTDWAGSAARVQPDRSGRFCSKGEEGGRLAASLLLSANCCILTGRAPIGHNTPTLGPSPSQT